MIYQNMLEIGCSGQSTLHNLLTPHNRLTIIECNPTHLAEIRKWYGGCPNVTIHPFAMWYEAGTTELHLVGQSSYLDGIVSPAICNDAWLPSESVMVECRTIDSLDDGSFDLLDLDIEGAEWAVISRMVSRPATISVEMSWANYINPHFDEITSWMASNRYWKLKHEGANTVFVRLAGDPVAAPAKAPVTVPSWQDQARAMLRQKHHPTP